MQKKFYFWEDYKSAPHIMGGGKGVNRMAAKKKAAAKKKKAASKKKATKKKKK